jgi:GNAT superfamily N-acetyltransferase
LTASYISHSELQGRRAIGPTEWVANINDVLRAEIRQRLREPLSSFPKQDKWQGVIELRTGEGLIGVSLVTITHDATVPFGIIEDIVVDGAQQGRGIGSRAMHWILDQFKKAGLKRAFLESGLPKRTCPSPI